MLHSTITIYHNNDMASCQWGRGPSMLATHSYKLN